MRATHRLKTLAVFLLAGGIAAAAWAQDGEKRAPRPATNLQVLPKNTPHDSLIAIMHDWESALGVECSFCHAKSSVLSGKLDFASDDNHHKDVARYMLRMTDSINRQFFARWDIRKEGHAAVGCHTCHHGQKEPQTLAPERKERD